MHTLQPSKVIQPCIEDGCKLADSFDQSDAQNMDTDQLISQESAGQQDGRSFLTSQASARQHWSTKLPSRSTRAALERLDFRPAHHTSEKDNTEYTLATVQAARIASTVISYTLLVLVHVQESYLQ